MSETALPQQLAIEQGTLTEELDTTPDSGKPMLQLPAPAVVDADGRLLPSPSSPGSQRPRGGTRLSTSSERSKSFSVQIVEPLPTFDGPRGSRAGFCTDGCMVAKSEEKHGMLQRAIPVMPFGLAVFACVLNIALPGVGTLVAALSVFCCGTTTRLENKLTAFACNIIAGLLQLTTFLVIIGWIWSISWGMNFVQLASQYKSLR